jgi:hypothetical protein
MSVRKRGRTTGLTYGSVDGIAATVNVDYGDGIGQHTLSNQVSIKADTTKNALFSDHGDSGSVIVDDQGYVIGLLFAGAGAGTVANPIAAVLSELNVSMCVGKLILKDIKDGSKDFVKEKEVAKDIKEKELKERVVDGKTIKDIVDNRQKRIFEVPPVGGPGDPGPELPGGGGLGPIGQLADRLDAIEARLSQLTSFIAPELRPDLRASAFTGEADLGPAELAGLQQLLERQAIDAAEAKAAVDGPHH